MLQQAIAEENCAGPSFDYNILTSRQSFGDRVGQQG